MAKQKEEIVRLHNQGKREFTLKNGVKSEPGKAIDVPQSIADWYVKNYPRDFMYYDDLVSKSETKKDLAAANKAVEAAEKTISEKDQAIAEKDKALEDKDLEIAELKAKLEAAEKTAAPADGGSDDGNTGNDDGDQ